MEPRIGRLLSLPTGTWADEGFEFSHQASQVALAGERDCRKGKGEKEGSLPLTGFFALFFFCQTQTSLPTFLLLWSELSHVATPTCQGSWETESNYVLRKKGNISATGRYECSHFTNEEMSGHIK